MGQCDAFHETWAYLRDNARPVVPDDVAQLEIVREFAPPSRAHIKRLARFRPAVCVARPAPAPDTTVRRRYANLIDLRNQSRRELSGTLDYRAHPIARPVVAPEPAVVIAGLLPAPDYVRHDVPRLEPDYRVAARLHRTMATFCGPLTRRQQAEYAFTVAQYGDVIYA